MRVQTCPLHASERRSKVCQQVRCVLNTHGNPNQAFRNPRGLALAGGKTSMRSCGRPRDQGLHAPERRRRKRQAQPAEQRFSCIDAAGKLCFDEFGLEGKAGVEGGFQ